MKRRTVSLLFLLTSFLLPWAREGEWLKVEASVNKAEEAASWEEITAKYYPTSEEVELMVQDIWRLSKIGQWKAEVLEQKTWPKTLGARHTNRSRFVRFSSPHHDSFYAFWQPAPSGPAPLLLHVPGYGAEMSAHPELVSEGYNVLHVCPLGYVTPDGVDSSKKVKGDWPVLPDTITSKGKEGYRHWLAQALAAFSWSQNQPEVSPRRVSTFGTSQGGGGALLLGSLLKDHGIRAVAADVPFLTNMPLANGRGAYRRVPKGLAITGEEGWKWIGFVDTLSHAHRLSCPVFLTAGGLDRVCPPETIETLYQKLPGIKGYIFLKETGHLYTNEFLPLATAWFRLFG